MIPLLHPIDLQTEDFTRPPIPRKDLLQLGGVFFFKIAGWSMFPTLQKGDGIEWTPCREYRIGDLVVFESKGNLICHRVVAMEEPDQKIFTQGDFSKERDLAIRPEAILGKVVKIIRGQNAFAPSQKMQAGRVDFLRMQTDCWVTACQSKIFDAVVSFFEFLGRRPRFRFFFTSLLKHSVKFYIGSPAPLRSVQAYQWTPLALSHPHTCFKDLPRDDQNQKEWILLAKLGGLTIGALKPSSGEMRIKSSLTGLGVERRLQELAREIQEWQKKQSK